MLVEWDFTVEATVGDGPSLLAAVSTHRPDLCVVDVRMPPTFVDEGLRAALVIRERWPSTGVIVLSQVVEERYASILIAENRGGVGYLLKDRVDDVGDFIEALRRVAGGGTALDPEVIRQLLARSRHTSPSQRLLPGNEMCWRR